jgi:hypothetical protein
VACITCPGLEFIDAKSRHESDDLDVLSRMLDPEEELEAAEQAPAAS